ncbi:hypothetical protein HGRIS_012220 [Hohenbuehelia grisea]|uniref:F-box domain-containing protein n=1 Tax=Hohenbuehelia grisea TaxID=104357 RepID=A0ABR3IRR5_9AGAR
MSTSRPTKTRSSSDGETSVADIDHEITSEKAEIERRQQIVYDLFQKRNSMQSVSRLPTYLLSCIFHMLQAEYLTNCHESDILPAFSKWLAITYVCRLWCRTAFQSPLLWSRIYIFRDQPSILAEQFLIRVQSAPITLIYTERESVWHKPAAEQATLYQRRAWEALEKTLKSPNAISSASIVFSSKEHFADTVTWLAPKIQHIEELTITIVPSGDYSVLPPVFQNNRAPNLRTLALRNCALSINSLFISSASETLTTLRLSTTTPLYSVETIVDVLRGMPLLQSLDLSGCLTASHEPTHYTGSHVAVVLKTLRHIQISSPYPSNLRNWDMIECPLATSVEVYTPPGPNASAPSVPAPAEEKLLACILRVLERLRKHSHEFGPAIACSSNTESYSI